MAGAVHFKFKSAKDYDTVQFGGEAIRTGDLKLAIFEQKRLAFGEGFDLQIRDAQTGEEYSDEAQLIPRNASVVVSRVPGLRPGGILSQQLMAKKNERFAEAAITGSQHTSGALAAMAAAAAAAGHGTGPPASMSAFHGAAPAAANALQNSASGDTGADPNEEEGSRIDSLIGSAGQGYDRSTYAPLRGGMRGGFVGMGGRGGANIPADRPPQPGPMYLCHRCQKGGHWIDQCPTNGDKAFDKIRVRRPTGIPSSMLAAVEAPAVGVGLQTSSGEFVALKPNEDEFTRQTAALRKARLAKKQQQARLAAGLPAEAPGTPEQAEETGDAQQVSDGTNPGANSNANHEIAYENNVNTSVVANDEIQQHRQTQPEHLDQQKQPQQQPQLLHESSATREKTNTPSVHIGSGSGPEPGVIRAGLVGEAAPPEAANAGTTNIGQTPGGVRAPPLPQSRPQHQPSFPVMPTGFVPPSGMMQPGMPPFMPGMPGMPMPPRGGMPMPPMGFPMMNMNPQMMMAMMQQMQRQQQLQQQQQQQQQQHQQPNPNGGDASMVPVPTKGLKGSDASLKSEDYHRGGNGGSRSGASRSSRGSGGDESHSEYRSRGTSERSRSPRRSWRHLEDNESAGKRSPLASSSRADRDDARDSFHSDSVEKQTASNGASLGCNRTDARDAGKEDLRARIARQRAGRTSRGDVLTKENGASDSHSERRPRDGRDSDFDRERKQSNKRSRFEREHDGQRESASTRAGGSVHDRLGSRENASDSKKKKSRSRRNR